MTNSLPIAIQIAIFLFLFTFLLSTTLEKPKTGSIIALRSGLIWRSLITNFIVMPLVGLVLAEIFQLSLSSSMGFLIVAAAPGGLLALHFVRIAKGNLQYAVRLVFLLSLLSIILTPLLIHLVFPDIQATSGLVLPLIGRLCLLILPPILIGYLIHYRLEFIVPRLQKIAFFLSILFFLALMVLTSTLKQLDTQTLQWNDWAAFVSLIVAAWAIGWLMGGSDLRDRKVLAISSSMRNTAICLAIVSSSVLAQDVNLAIIGFSEVLTPMNLISALVMTRIKPVSEIGETLPSLNP